MSYDTKWVQEALMQLGYYLGEIDGIVGPLTRKAIVAFKQDNGLRARPYIGPFTLLKLQNATRKPVPRRGRRHEPPWINEITKVLGLHEVHNNGALTEWLRSDGGLLGDPAKLPWCFRGDVEILTEEGWQRFDELSASRVYQADADGNLSLTEFTPVVKEYHGPLDVIDHQSFTLHADPEHRWWGHWGTEGRVRNRRAPEFKTLSEMTTQGVSIPRVQAQGPGCGLDRDQLELVAATLSDGSVRRGKITFEVSRERKVQSLSRLGPDHYYKQKKFYGPLTTKPLEVFTFNWPSWMSAVITEEKELDRDFINSMNQSDAQAFLEGYRKYDGSEKRFHLYTSSKQRRDDLSQIVTMAGWFYGVTTKKGGFNDRPCWEIHIKTRCDTVLLTPKLVDRTFFIGRLYCVTVPEHRIVVREHGRGAIVTGNCGDAVETAIKRALPGEPFPAKLDENPYWARNWNYFGVRCGLVYGAVVTFSRGSGGHVGFLVGRTADGLLLRVRGGNQSNEINDTWISVGRLLESRWPTTYPTRFQYPAPTMDHDDGIISTNEA